MKKRLLVLFIAMLMVLPFVHNVAAQDQTIADIAASNPDFSTLVSLVEAAGLTDVLKSEGPFTVFAPTNEAFAKLPQIALDYLAANPAELTKVLTYHVIAGKVLSADVTDMMAPSMEMAAVGDAPTGSELDIKTSDAGVTVNGFHVTTADIEASNGVIHVIDGVLIPPQTLPEVTPATLTGDLPIDGSSTVEPLTVALAKRFQDDGFSGNITVGESGTGGGFKAFCEELTILIADASRAIKTSGDAAAPDELEKCVANGREPVGFRVGTDGIAIVTNPQNTFATDLTSDEIIALFSTAVKWSDVRADFPAEDIIRYIPGTDSGTFDYFVEKFFATEPAPVLAATQLNQSENDNVLVQGVEGNQYAVGFFGYAYYNENSDKLSVLSIDGVAPTFETVESAAYKLARPLYIYSTAQIMAENPQVAGFINYYLTNVQDEIGAVGYFPASAQALNAAKLWYLAAAYAGAQ